MKRRIPPWALIAGAVVIGAVIYLWKKNKEKKEIEESKETTGEQPYIAGVEGQEGEYPYSIAGGSGGGPGALGNANETVGELKEIFGTQREERKEESRERKEERSSFETGIKSLSEQLSKIQTANASGTNQSSTQNQGGGGGAQSEPRPGTTVAPTRPGDRCGHGTHAGFPLGTPPDCYRISRDRTGHNCQCHGHQNGHLECQRWSKQAGCYW